VSSSSRSRSPSPCLAERLAGHSQVTASAQHASVLQGVSSASGDGADVVYLQTASAAAHDAAMPIAGEHRLTYVLRHARVTLLRSFERDATTVLLALRAPYELAAPGFGAVAKWTIRHGSSIHQQVAARMSAPGRHHRLGLAISCGSQPMRSPAGRWRQGRRASPRWRGRRSWSWFSEGLERDHQGLEGVRSLPVGVGSRNRGNRRNGAGQGRFGCFGCFG